MYKDKQSHWFIIIREWLYRDNESKLAQLSVEATRSREGEALCWNVFHKTADLELTLSLSPTSPVWRLFDE